MTVPFIGLPDMSAVLGRTLPDTEDALLNHLVVISMDSACEMVRTDLGNPINLQEVEVRLDGTGTWRLVLPAPPIRVVDLVTEDDVALVEEDDWVLESAGILRRVGQRWSRGLGNVVVVCTRGWDVTEDLQDPEVERVPSDIRAVALNAAKRLFGIGQEAVGAGSLISETLGEYTYRLSERAISEAARLGLTEAEREGLAAYRDLALGVGTSVSTAVSS